MKTQIETEVNQIGPFKIVRLGADEQNIDEETESWMTQDTRNNNWNGPFSDRYSAEQFAREAIPSKPLWQMDVRHRLDLRPGRTDPVSMLLWSAIYGSESEREFIARVEQHLDELRRALNVAKGEKAK